jgi:hypothetical protein
MRSESLERAHTKVRHHSALSAEASISINFRDDSNAVFLAVIPTCPNSSSAAMMQTLFGII